MKPFDVGRQSFEEDPAGIANYDGLDIDPDDPGRQHKIAFRMRETKDAFRLIAPRIKAEKPHYYHTLKDTTDAVEITSAPLTPLDSGHRIEKTYVGAITNIYGKILIPWKSGGEFWTVFADEAVGVSSVDILLSQGNDQAPVAHELDPDTFVAVAYLDKSDLDFTYKWYMDWITESWSSPSWPGPSTTNFYASETLSHSDMLFQARFEASQPIAAGELPPDPCYGVAMYARILSYTITPTSPSNDAFIVVGWNQDDVSMFWRPTAMSGGSFT
jgi:hypothetical protein